MKKYKLIKKYPGSPELGHIAEPVKLEFHQGFSYCWNNTYFKPEDHPEFWEKCSQKINSYYRKNIGGKGNLHVDSNYIWFRGRGGWSRLGHLTHPYSDEEIENNEDYGIYSVTTSNNDILTIGDVVKNRAGQSFVISKFYYNCTGDKILCNGEGTGAGHVNIDKVERCSVLFVSEEGENVYEGDTVYKVNSNYELEKSFVCSNEITLGKKCKYFKNRADAIDFIVYNKPSLPLKAVKEYWSKETVRKFIIAAADEWGLNLQ